MKTKYQTNASKDLCRFCGEWVILNDEGVTFADGGCAHEGCNDSNEFTLANASDFRD